MQIEPTTVMEDRPVADLGAAALRGLLALDACAAGGVAALVLVQRTLLTTMNRSASASSAGEIVNLVDKLLPLHLAFGGGLLLLALLTASAVSWRRLPRPWSYSVAALSALLILTTLAMRILGIR